MRPPLSPGRVAISRQGRDKNRVYVVLCELDADFVLVVDGSLRGLDKPKKKRRKHLLAAGSQLSLPHGGLSALPDADHKIRQFLSNLQDPNPKDPA